MDFETLLRKCKKGDRQAQQELYSTFKNKMMGICLRYSFSTAEADDIFQDAFVRVFKNIYHLKDAGAMEAWIRKIVIRTAINHYHKQKKSVVLESDLHQVNQNIEFDPISSEINLKDLLNMVRGLPQGYRMVFNLFVIDGFSHKEIASMLSISENTSKSQLRKAKLHLKNQLIKLKIKY